MPNPDRSRILAFSALCGAATCAALALASVGQGEDRIAPTDRLILEHKPMAQSLAVETVPSLEIQNREQTRELLARATDDPGVLGAAVYSQSGLQFASHGANSKVRELLGVTQGRKATRFEGDTLLVVTPIKVDGIKWGDLVLAVDASKALADQPDTIPAKAWIFGLATLLALFISFKASHANSSAARVDPPEDNLDLDIIARGDDSPPLVRQVSWELPDEGNGSSSPLRRHAATLRKEVLFEATCGSADEATVRLENFLVSSRLDLKDALDAWLHGKSSRFVGAITSLHGASKGVGAEVLDLVSSELLATFATTDLEAAANLLDELETAHKDLVRLVKSKESNAA